LGFVSARTFLKIVSDDDPSWCFAQGTATGAAGNASAVVLGSCNVVQQNVAATGQATIINEINCVPEKPEDSFLLRLSLARCDDFFFHGRGTLRSGIGAASPSPAIAAIPQQGMLLDYP
jgi:hypothetical protein